MASMHIFLISSLGLFNLTSICKSDAPINVIIPSTSASNAASISSLFVLVKQIVLAFNPSFAIVFTAFFSFSDTIGNPASI